MLSFVFGSRKLAHLVPVVVALLAPALTARESHAQSAISSACVKAQGGRANVSKSQGYLNVSIQITNQCKAPFKIVLTSASHPQAVDNQGGAWRQTNPRDVSGIGAIGSCSRERKMQECLEEKAETIATEMHPGSTISVVFTRMRPVNSSSKKSIGDHVTLAFAAQFKELNGRGGWRGLSLDIPSIRLEIEN